MQKNLNQIFTTRYQSPVGLLIIGDYNGLLCLLDWLYRAKRAQIDKRICDFFKAKFVEQETDLHKVVQTQLDEYFAKSRNTFDLPLLFAGTEFQKKVWQQLVQIPHGKTVSYLNLSKQLGDEKAIRAVASANGANAISIVVPCHRVVGSNGELVGYAGGKRAKQQLLELEGGFGQMELGL